MADISRIFTYRRRSNFSRFHFTFRLFQTPAIKLKNMLSDFLINDANYPSSTVSQQSIPFFTTYKMIRLFSLYFSHSLLRDDDRPPVKFVRKSFITLRNLDGALYRSIAKLSFPSEAIIIDIDEKIFTSFHVFIYLSASSRSIQPRHINIISTSFYFIFPTIHRALFPTPSSIIFIKFKLITLHDVSLHLILPYVSFHLLLKFHHAKWFTFFYPQ